MVLNKGLSRAVGAVAVVTVLGQLLNVGQEMAIAAFFGTSAATDSYKMALVIPTMLTLELATIIGAVVIPVFHEQQKFLNPSEIFSVGFNFIATVAFTIAAAVYLFSPYLINIVARGFSEETRVMASFLLRVLSFGVFFSLLSLFLSNILNINKYFVFPALQRIFLYAGTLTGLFLIGRVYGIAGAAFGFVIGLGVFVIIQIALVLKKIKYSFSFGFVHPVVQSMVILAAPLFFYSILNQLNVLVEKRIVSGFEPGSLSALDFAFKLSAFFINFLVVGINTVLFPTLSKSFVSDDHERISAIFHQLMNGLAAIIIPTTVLFVMLGKPIVHLVFERGSFDARSTALTSKALSYYAIGLIGQGCVSSLPRFFQAFRKNATLLQMGAVAVFFNIAAMLVLSHVFGFIGIAGATSLTALFYSVLLFSRIRSEVKFDGRDLLRTIFKIVLATSGFGIVLSLSNRGFQNLRLFSGLPENFLEVVAPIILGGTIYIVLSKVLNVEIVGVMIQRMMQFVARRDDQ